MGWFSRWRKAPLADEAKASDIGDAEVAQAMRNLAEKFIAGTAVEGWDFTWDCTQVSQLDEACDAFIHTDPPPEVRHSMIMGMGAYLGELLIRCGGGRWSYDAKAREAIVIMPNGLDAYPHSKVAKRLDFGAEHNLFHYFHYALTREVLPGSKLTEY